jgi:polyisoprenoid-binding protein YceI
MNNRLVGIGALALLALVLFTAPARAEQALVPAQSEISFTSRQMGVSVDGAFESFTAQIHFDPKNVHASRIALAIDLSSVSIGNAETTAELTKAPWFDSKRIPKATFESTSVKAGAAGGFDITGKLAIKGREHEVRVPVTLTQASGRTTATGSFVIKRLDYRIGDGDWADTSVVADDVQVKFKLVLTGLGPL